MIKNISARAMENSGLSHELIFAEVSELDGIVFFIIGSVCKRFGLC